MLRAGLDGLAVTQSRSSGSRLNAPKWALEAGDLVARDAAARFRAARLDRMLHRALHELQRLQARRSGADVPPPLMVDVDVRGLGSLEDPPPEQMPAPSSRG
jgi:hypothetical protein